MPTSLPDAPVTRDSSISIRVSEWENAELEARARAARRHFSDYARYTCVCGPIEVRNVVVLPFLVVNQLLRIRVNLNQLLELDDVARVHDAVGNLSDRLAPIVSDALDAHAAGQADESEERTKKRHFRVTKDQETVILALAEVSGRNVSDFSREMLCHGRVIVRHASERDFSHFEELCDLGALLNAKTRKGNAKGKTPFDLLLLLKRINEILDREQQE